MEQELFVQFQVFWQWVEDVCSIGFGSLIDDVVVFVCWFNDYLLADYLWDYWFGFYQLGSLLGWIWFELDEVNWFFEDVLVYGEVFIDWESLLWFFFDFVVVFFEVGYGWGIVGFEVQYLFFFYYLGEWLNVQCFKGFFLVDVELRDDGEKLYVLMWVVGIGGVVINFGFEFFFLG